MEWQSLMERSTPNMSYQAWRHEPEVDIHSLVYITSIFFFHSCAKLGN